MCMGVNWEKICNFASYKPRAMKLKASFKRGLVVAKYMAVIIVAIAIVGFADENSAWNHYRNNKKIEELQAEIAFYRNAYSRDTAQLHQYEVNPKAVERVAREKYFMQRDDEDVFVLYEQGE